MWVYLWVFGARAIPTMNAFGHAMNCMRACQIDGSCLPGCTLGFGTLKVQRGAAVQTGHCGADPSYTFCRGHCDAALTQFAGMPCGREMPGSGGDGLRQRYWDHGFPGVFLVFTGAGLSRDCLSSGRSIHATGGKRSDGGAAWHQQ